MVTAADIAQHDRRVDRAIRGIESAIVASITAYVEQIIDNLDTTPTAATLRTLLLSNSSILRQFQQQFGIQLSAVVLDQYQLLGYDTNPTTQTVANTVIEAAQREFDTQFEGLFEAAIAALLLGTISNPSPAQFRSQDPC